MNWDELKSECEKCTRCELCESRNNVVLGVGNRSSQVLFIGEAPGAEEDKKGEPFVGRAGRLLDEMLKIIGLSRKDNIYIANIIKCRPPDNRDPQITEREACAPWLRAQIELIKPKIIVCLGRIAAVTVLETDLVIESGAGTAGAGTAGTGATGTGTAGEFKITRDHGKWYDRNGIKIMAIYHPAALLRDPYKKPDTFVDLKAIERELG